MLGETERGRRNETIKARDCGRMSSPAAGVRMSCHVRVAIVCSLVVTLSGVIRAQAPAEPVSLIVAAGRPLRVRVTDRVAIKRVGQIVTAAVIDPVFAYDRVVIPSGATVTGHVAGFEEPPRWSRLRAKLAGDFTPQHTPIVQFDTLALPDGTRLPISTAAATGRERIVLSTTTAARTSGVIERGKAEAEERVKGAIGAAKQRFRDAVAAVKAPGKMQRIKDAAISQLPYHPQYLSAGTVFTAELAAPVSLGEIDAAERVVSDRAPSPESVLTARLVTPLDSAKTPKGTPMQAVLIEPLFSADHQLVFPEGTVLDGEVTFAKHAASMHRNGQLRFLVERVHPPERAAAPMLASLYAVEGRQDDRLVVDDEGGASATNSKTRFIAPALAALSLHAAVDQDHRRFDHDADDNDPVVGQANIGGRGVAGWFGFGLVGAGISQLGRPVALAFGIYGAARTTYSNVLGKGREVQFPANTLIQVQLSPVAKGAQP
jgi:hypothetical protein